MTISYNSEYQLENKVILVTGGTGSFGKSFVTYILDKHNPKKVIVYSRDEDKQYHFSNLLTKRYPSQIHSKVRFFIGDVRDVRRLTMAANGVDVLIHAAAAKHVPSAEYNPMECVKTNIHGAENVVEAALAAGVRRVVALSTDKAVNPINLYGATKLAADKIFVAANHLSGSSPTRFANVRYGNVLGSRGSVIPFFKNLVDQGESELPITSQEMTRFWISIEQGISFVLSCMSLMQGGETFVPKIPSMKITDIARLLAPQLEQTIVGLRPGEKLHEVMISNDDAPYTYDLGDRFVVQPSIKFYDDRYEYLKKAKAVESDFVFASNTNESWLSDEQFYELVTKHLPL